MADAVSYFLGLFGVWFKLIAAPFASGNSDVLWIIIPIYASWMLAEYYQEKSGTSIGNAISNGFVGVWVGVDWARRLVAASELTISFLGKALITLFMLAYGLLIIYNGMKGRHLAVLLGRVKEISYLMIVFSPIVYGLVPLTVDTLISITVFFPIVYGITELIDRITPTPSEEAAQPKPAVAPIRTEIPSPQTNYETEKKRRD